MSNSAAIIKIVPSTPIIARSLQAYSSRPAGGVAKKPPALFPRYFNASHEKTHFLFRVGRTPWSARVPLDPLWPTTAWGIVTLW